MTWHQWDDGFWSDPDFEELSAEARLLYIYLSTNQSVGAAGVYKQSIKRMATPFGGCGLGIERTRIALRELVAAGKVRWFEERDIVWVPAWTKRGVQSPKLIRKAVDAAMGAGMLEEWLDHNRDRLTRREKWPETLSDALAVHGYRIDGSRIGYPECEIGFPHARESHHITSHHITEEKGGSGEPAPSSGPSDTDTSPSSPQSTRAVKAEKTKQRKRQAQAALDAYNRMAGRSLSSSQLVEQGMARLKEGATQEQLELVCEWATKGTDKKARSLQEDGYTTPSTCWRKKHFQTYLDFAREWLNGKNGSKPKLRRIRIQGREAVVIADGIADAGGKLYRQHEGQWREFVFTDQEHRKPAIERAWRWAS